MALPTSRQTFKEYCLRKLGAPVTQINVDEDQVDDRIDDALQYYWDFHFDGTEKMYYKALITQQDFDNKYITLPDNIIGAVRIFPIGSSLSTNNLFNIRYQIALNDLYDLTATSMVPYYMAMQHIQFLEQLLVGEQPIRFNRRMNRLYVDMDWKRLNPGEHVIIEAFQVVDPDTFTKVWSDRWLQKYATEMIKQQWGQNLIKFQGVSLPGGMQFNGEKLYNDATAEISKLEADMIRSYSVPVAYFLG
jgi:hypothetical protein